MKKVISLFLTVFVLMIAGAGLSGDVSAYAVTSGDFEYIVLEDGTAEIIGYTGTDTALEIPSELDGYTVTSIGEAAFEDGSSLEEITIPAGVTSISSSAFEGCSSLSAIHVDENNTVYSSENGVLFNQDETEQILYSASTSQISVYAAASGDFSYDVLDDGTAEITGYTGSDTVLEIPSEIDGYTVTSIGDGAFEYCTSLTDVTIGNGVISIGDWAFSSCDSLTEIIIPNSVTSIGSYAFDDCTSLTEVTIPDSVTSIGNSAFYYCTSLTEITIPDSVTSIGTYAFYNCTSLTNVTLGNSVTSIGNYTFYGCTGLTEITIPDSVTSIGSYAFYYCSRLLSVSIGNGVTSIGYSAFSDCTGLTEVIIPNSVTSIENYAFRYCTNLTSVTLGNGVTTTGDYVFYGCTGLTNVTMGNSVTSIGNYAFRGCTSLTEITLPDSVTSIGYYAFYGCTGLTEITLPDSVTSIGYYAFYGCTSLTEITLPDSVTSIGTYAFYNCTSLTNVTLGNSVTSIGNYTFYGCTGLTNVVIGNSVTSIGLQAFFDCTSLTEITIPDSVTSIGYMAFYNCTSLTEITIPDSVTSIGNFAFYGCTRLTEITLPDSVTSIGSSVFYECSSLTEITIPDSVTSIGSSAFNGCTSLTEITIPDSVTSIGSYAFSGCTSLTEITIPDSITSIGDYTFYECTSLTEITIPDSVTSIGIYTFYGCTGLTNITIPDSVTSIGDSAFYGCTSLTEITIGNSVTSIGGSAFYGCTSLTEITIGNSVTSIGGSAFYSCTGLTNVVIGNSVTSIGNSAFYGCTSLTKITIGNSVTSIERYAFYGCTGLTEITIPDSVTSISEGVFRGCTSLINVTIGNSVTRIGNSAFYGCTSLAEIAIPDSVTSIGTYAFYGCTGLTNITIPDSVTSIGSAAFRGCTSLTEITLPDSVTSIGSSAFYGCTSLTEITLPDSVTSIDYMAFYNCTSLTEITIPDSVTSIGDYAFYYCWSLTEITIPDSVTSIGNYAFRGCTSLTEITIPDSVTSIGYYAFAYCTRLTEITLPDSVTSIGRYAFYGCTGLTNITLPNSVTSIENYAFRGCTSLTEITIPDSVTSIGSYAFAYCTSLTEITIGNSVTSIGGSAFYNCTGLTDVYYTGTEEEWNAISISGGNTYLTNATIHYETENVFSYTVLDDGTAEITGYTGSDTVLEIPSEIDGYTVTSIGYSAFYGCTGLTEITIPNSVTSIGYRAFEYCASLTEITIPDSVTSIGEWAFAFCESLTEITIPDSVTNIGEYAFYECTGLTEINVDENNTAYSSQDGVLFNKDKTQLIQYPAGNERTSYTILDSVTSISEWAFYLCGNLTEITIPDSVTSIDYGTFYGCTSLTEITIPNSVTSIGEWAFAFCISLTEITLPDSVTRIGEWAFACCISLTEITIPDSVTSIGYGAFAWCYSLTEITIPDSVTSIGDYAFSDCTGLTDVYYTGTEEEWNAISIGSYNEYLTNATIHYEATKILSYNVSVTVEGTVVTVTVTLPGELNAAGGNFILQYDNEKVVFSKTVSIATSPSVVEIPNYTENSVRASWAQATAITQDTVLWVMEFEYIGGTLSAEDFAVTAFRIYDENTQLISTETTAGAVIDFTCNHAETQEIITAEPTHTETGICENVCIVCGETVSTESISAVEHDYGEWVETVAPTCTQAGEETRTCECGATETREVAATGHDWDDGVVTKAPSCTETGILTYTCSKCLELKTETIDKTEHVYVPTVVEPTCTEEGYTKYVCSACQETVVGDFVDALGHDYSDEWTVDEEATCVSDGSKSHHCTRCDSRADVTVIEATGHSYGEWQTRKEATCTENGIEYKACSQCGDEETREIAATGHDWDDGVVTKAPSCTETGILTYTCSKCLELKTETIDKTEHVYVPTVVEPTCTEEGYTKYVCSACQETVFDDFVDALGHDYSVEWTVDEEATCVSNGSKSHHCSRCDSRADVTVIEAAGHSYGEWYTRNEVTCTEDGIDYRVCSLCGDEETLVTSSLGHNYGSWTVTKEATVLCEGTEERACTRCSDVEVRSIDKLQIDINETEEYGLANFTVVNAQTEEPIENANIYISTENDGENTFSTDADGKVSIILPVGLQYISVFADGCITRNLNITVNAGVNDISVIGLSDKSTYDAEISSHLMTAEEIEEAGIDVSAQDNQLVYEYELQINFDAEIDWESIIAYFDGDGNYLGGYYGEKTSEEESQTYTLHYSVNHKYSQHSSSCQVEDVEVGQNISLSYVPERDDDDYVFDGWYADSKYSQKITSVDIESYDETGSYETTVYGRWVYVGEGDEPINSFGAGGIQVSDDITVYPVTEYFYLIVYGEVKWQKEIFDIEMLVINNSMTDTLEDLSATLELPDGLSLATMSGEQQSLTQEIGTIEEGGSASVHWYVRGDEAGSYSVSATLNGKVMPFEEEINDKFIAESSIQVWADNALHLNFEIPDAAYYGEDYNITITLTNISDITLYNVRHLITVVQGMEIYYEDGSSKKKIETSQWNSSGVKEFNPGDQIIVEVAVNIFFESEVIEQQLESLIGLVDGVEALISGIKAVTAGLKLITGLVNKVTSAVTAIDTFLSSSALATDKLSLISKLKSSIVNFSLKYSKTGSSALDSAIKVSNSTVGVALTALSEDPESWLSKSTVTEIADLIKNIDALEESISQSDDQEAIDNFDIFDSLRTLISAIPIRFALQGVIMNEDENNSARISWSYSVVDTGVQYFGVSSVGSYMSNVLKGVAAETYEELVSSYIQILPGLDDPLNYDDIKREIIAVENEIKQFKAKDATGEVTFTASIVSNGSSSLSAITTLQSVESNGFILSCDNETAVVENGVLTFTGDGTIEVTPTSLQGGTLYIEDSEGNTYIYDITVVEQHECSASEWKTVISPTTEYDGFAVKCCDICDDILEIKNLSASECEQHSFGEWCVELDATFDSMGIKTRVCSICGYEDIEFTEKTDVEINDDETALPEDYEQVIELISESDESIIYDIKFVQNGEEVQLTESITVKIRVPEDMDASACKVYRLEDDGTYTDMGAVCEDDVLIFTTETVGRFVITTGDPYDTEIILGDVTGDGIVDAADVVMVQRYDAGLITLSAEQLEAADVTGDGIVDAADVVMIQRYDAGLISSL